MFGIHSRLSQLNIFELFIGSHELNRVSKLKYLGKVYDDRLSWKANIRHCISEGRKRVGMLAD